LNSFPRKLYSVIYADPPWMYRDKCMHRGGAARHYQTMSIDDIANLPVENISKKDSVLFLWTTCPMLPVALSVMSAWDFIYKTVAFVWIKTTSKGSFTWGMGNWTRANAEICLLGIRGKPKRVSARVHQVIMTPREEHSRKPDVVREKIVELMGDIPRIELFARQKAPGWDVWGVEV